MTRPEVADEERARLKMILETSPGVVVTYVRDLAGRVSFQFVSARAKELLGFTAEELLADSALMTARMHPDDLSTVAERFNASASTGETFVAPYRYRHPTRGEIWLEGRGTPVAQQREAFVWNGVLLDITESKRVEEQLSLIRLQLESALSAAEIGAWILDCDTNLVWLSEGLRVSRQLPASTPEWIDVTSMMSYFHPDDLTRGQEVIAHALATGGRLEAEFRTVLPDGTVRWVASRGRAELHPDGRPRRLVGVDVDITKQKLAAEAAQRSQKLEALGTLAGGIAHDFNNVLFAIGGNATLALDALPENAPAEPFLREILSASSRATELVRQILAFSRPEQNKGEVTPLVPAVDEGLRLIRTTLPSHIELVTDLDPRTAAVGADSARLIQLIVNLCSNAVQALSKVKRGRIEVSVAPLDTRRHSSAPGVTKPGDSVRPGRGPAASTDADEACLCPAGQRVPEGMYALLVVRDNGPGIDRAVQARICDPFFTTRPLGEGSGLGLSIVQGIMAGLDGYLTVSSRPGQGATFRLYFPAMPDPPSQAVPTSLPVADGAQKRVLFVDDEAMLVTLAKNVLSRLGYDAHAYQDANRALDEFRADPWSFAAVVTDLSMPAMSGFELAHKLLEIRPDVPILMVSGYFAPEDAATGAQLGIRQLVHKPLSMRRLGELLSDIC
jgi:PAS domain S-box-containing protein